MTAASVAYGSAYEYTLHPRFDLFDAQAVPIEKRRATLVFCDAPLIEVVAERSLRSVSLSTHEELALSLDLNAFREDLFGFLDRDGEHPVLCDSTDIITRQMRR